MTEPISTGYAAFKFVLDGLRLLRDTDKAWGEAEFKMKMSSLVEKMMDIQENLVSSREQNVELRGKLLDAEKKLTAAHEFEWSEGKYWKLKAEGGKEGPYCPKCKDGGGKIARLVQKPANGGQYWECTVCNKAFDVPPSPPRRIGMLNRGVSF